MGARFAIFVRAGGQGSRARPLRARRPRGTRGRYGLPGIAAEIHFSIRAIREICAYALPEIACGAFRQRITGNWQPPSVLLITNLRHEMSARQDCLLLPAHCGLEL